MATRSRKGCIDCKKAKIKCDELHPACGTCARRSRKCRGYLNTTGKNLRGGGSTNSADSFTGIGSLGNSHGNGIAPLLPLAQMGGAGVGGTGAATARQTNSSCYARPSLFMPYGRPPGRTMSAASTISSGTVTSSTIVVAAPETAAGSPADDRPMDIPWAPIEWQDMPSVPSMSSMPGMPCMPGVSSPYADSPYTPYNHYSPYSQHLHQQHQQHQQQQQQQHNHYQHLPPSPYPGSSYPRSPYPASSYTTISHAATPGTPAAVVSPPMLGGDLDLTALSQSIFSPSETTTTTITIGATCSSHSDHRNGRNSNSSSSSNIHDLLLDDDPNDIIDDELLTLGAATHATTSSGSSGSSPLDSGHTSSGSSPASSRAFVGPDDRHLIGPAAAAMSTLPVLEVSRLWSPPLPAPIRGPSFMPLNEILAEDKPFIELYFMRHPAEMVMSSSMFINEMNGAVLSLLQVSPIIVGDSLCAIGENYIRETAGNNNDPATGNGDNVVSHRKTRLLSRLRLLNEDGSSPELVLLLLLALCGAELTNPKSDGKGSSLPSLIENVAMILEFHTRSGHEISTTAKYFAKGVARQDLLHSLSRMQRPKIQPSTWLDDYAMRHADRLLGLTATLTPILYKLAELAGDVQAILNNDAFYHGNVNGSNPTTAAATSAGHHHHPHHDPSLPSMATTGAGDMEDGLFGDNNDNNNMSPCHYLTQCSSSSSNLTEREAAIRAELLMWRPIHDASLSIETSRALLLHAVAWRAAALLYLYRLFNRPGSSPDADQTALSMAYEVMMHINSRDSVEDIKLSLWPLFVAACELDRPEDRALAATLFDDVCRARPIMTARRTREFVMDQVWPARDRGEVWDWMQLTTATQSGGGPSNVFMPL